jgi:hypothetical protein
VRSKTIHWAVTKDSRLQQVKGFFCEVQTSFFHGAIMPSFVCIARIARFDMRALFYSAKLANQVTFKLLTNPPFEIFQYLYRFFSFPFK